MKGGEEDEKKRKVRHGRGGRLNVYIKIYEGLKNTFCTTGRSERRKERMRRRRKLWVRPGETQEGERKRKKAAKAARERLPRKRKETKTFVAAGTCRCR